MGSSGQKTFFYFLASLLSASIISIGWRFDFLFDDAFISFRITENIRQFGKPNLFQHQDVYTSTSLLYPFLNLIPAWIFGAGWTDKIQLWNGCLMALSMIVCLYRAGQSTGNFQSWHQFLTMLLLFPWFLEFRNLIYGNSGLETTWYMMLLSLCILPGKIEWLAPWLIFIRPEGWLAGWAVLFDSILKKNFRHCKRIILQLGFSLGFWALTGWGLYGTAIPQSLLAKANHLIDRPNEIAKGFSYLLFSGHSIPLALFLIYCYQFPKSWKSDSLTLIWTGLYLFFFSVLAAWWPWYLPPLFVAFWYLSAKASLTLCQKYLSKENSGLRSALSTAGLAIIGIWQTKAELPKIREASEAYEIRKIASQNLCQFLVQNIPSSKEILLEPLGMNTWFGRDLKLLDYPGLANPKMAGFIKKLPWKVPHRLTDHRTDSAILVKFKPDVLVLWPEEIKACQKITGFEIQYKRIKILPYYPKEKRMDSVSIFQKNQELN